MTPRSSLSMITTMNGQDAFAIIPCVFFLLAILFGIGLFAVWVLALIHAAMSKMENQAVWILVIILGGPIGAVVYFIARPFKSDPT
jgi:Phospholipase_D-nuclease N-terminal